MAKNGKKILVVEDDKFLIKAYNIKFTKEGFNVVTAMDGVSGLDQAKSELPKLILLDLMLPKIDGFEFLKRMAQDEKIKNIPVIILSNLGQQSDKDKALSLGAKEYLIKADYSLDNIIEFVNKHIG
ncbi:MAG: response regulator [Candidatus Paceibacterota bacterium]|jgi:DNA-binding response OmpR family regulator